MRLLQCLVGVYLLAVSNVLCRGLTNRQDYVVTVEEASRAKIPKEEWEKQRKFDNGYGKPMKVECNTKKGEAIYRVESEQNHGEYDRIWKWSCKRIVNTPLTSCKWTDKINDWNGPISFMCPMNQVITGLSSKHTKASEDRRWKVQCCSVRGYHTEGCTLTDFLNKKGERFMHHSKSTCRATRAFTGFVTNHYTPHDRRWKLLECAVTCDDKSRLRSSRPSNNYN
ncbi:hemagglutinin/amebocyte aggregation factor-like [Halichondria panicea]|uniref:hemagglutinin/amebocyte aggregation factor-like n=1 Tax=Halichondria panicea TaxID=6063 RepID=UPI00312B8C15